LALAFAIPWRRHGRAVKGALTASVGAGFAATASWGAYASSVYVTPRLPASLAPFGAARFAAYTHVDPQRQERYMLHHPWSFVRAMGRTLSFYGPHLLRETVAQIPLFLLPVAIVIVGWVLIVARAAVPEPRAAPVLGWRSRAVLVGIAVVTFVSLMALAYIGWNAVGSPRVEAFQGRYFLPLLPLLLLAVPGVRVRDGTADQGRATLALTVASPALLVAVAIGIWLHLY
jgi:hypothetical protein